MTLGRGGAAAARPWDLGAGPGWSPPRRRRGGQRDTGASLFSEGVLHARHPRPDADFSGGLSFSFSFFFVKWPPQCFEKLRQRNGGTAECPDGMAQGARLAHALLRGRGAPTSKVRLSAYVELCRLRPAGSTSVFSSLVVPRGEKKTHGVLNVALLCPKFVAPR